MTTTDLDRIEQALGFPLPPFYRAFIVDYPRWLLDRPTGQGRDRTAPVELDALRIPTSDLRAA